MRNRRWIGRVVLASFGAVLALFVACSNNGEGERCEKASDNFGNDDCNDGLICKPPNELNNSSSARCCPPDPTRATVDVCRVFQSPVGADGSAPVDATPPSRVDSGADAGDASTTTDAADASDAADDVTDAADEG